MRQPRGERRRTAILEAALRVIAERGAAATTHRAVAGAAGVPTSTTTYYFESLDDLLDEALLLFIRAEAGRLHALADELDGRAMPPAEIARLLVRELRAGDDRGDVAQFELYLEASRRPSLRGRARVSPPLRGGRPGRAARGGLAPPEEGAHAYVALLDGLGLHRIASGAEQGVERALLSLFIPFAMDDEELQTWRDRLAR